MLLVAITVATTTFAQKSKMNDSNGNAVAVQVQNPCPVQTKMCAYCNSTSSKKEQMKMEVMKIYTCFMHTQVVKKDFTECSGCNSQIAIDRRSSKQAGTINNCSMDVDRNSVKTGKCPVCKMDLNISKG